MKDLDHILELLQLRWALISAVMLLVVVTCLSVFYLKRGFWPRTAMVVVSLAGAVWLLAGIPTDYSLILLSSEEDNTAESGFNFLQGHLSNRQLIRLLSQGEKDHAYLASNNARFYLALIAARRGLHLTNVNQLGRPRFFGSNSCNSYANGLHFPLSYEEFLRKYAETAEQE